MWALITHNRQEQCQAVIDQINIVGCNSKGIIFVNGGLPYEIKNIPKDWLIYHHPQNIGVCHAMNHVFKDFPNEPYYGLICDDEYVYTPEWDKKLSEAASDWNISHGNDGWQSNDRIHSYVTVGGKLVRECGWWSLPGLWHWYHDDVQEVIANTLRVRKNCVNVKTEHKHYMAKKAVKDETYLLGESRAIDDERIFKRWLNNEAQDLISRIQGKINDNCNRYY